MRELSGVADRTLKNFPTTYSHLITDAEAGGVLVAIEPSNTSLVGVLTYSVQSALRTGGRYAIIQELWVCASGRSTGVGQALISELWEHLSDDITDVEVGLPPASFDGIARTSSFYERNGFSTIGIRSRAQRPEAHSSASQ